MRLRHLLPAQSLFQPFSNPDSKDPLRYSLPLAMRPVAFRICPLTGRPLAESFKKESGCPAGPYLAGRFAGGI